MKRILTILFIIMLFITIIQFRSTYALYRTQKTEEMQLKLGVWSVKVNETDLSSGAADLILDITEDHLYFEESEDIDSNYIGPGSIGYFDMLIDPTNTEVSIKYGVQMNDWAKIKISDSELELPTPIPMEIIGIEEVFIKDSEIDTTTEHSTHFDEETKSVFGIIPLSVIEAGYKAKVRVKFKWIFDGNDEFDTMLGNPQLGKEYGYSTGSNEVDEALVESDEQSKIVIPIRLQLTQYMGEDITESTFEIPEIVTP